MLPELPLLADLIKSLYDSHYDKFFVALGTPRLHFSLRYCSRIPQRNSNKPSFSPPVSSRHTPASMSARCASSHTTSSCSRTAV